MPRRPREDVAGAIHHVWARGNRKEAIFQDHIDRLRYLALLGQVVARWEWRCLTYCLMGNHMHLIVETPEPTLAFGMHELHGEHATLFNRRHGLSGHLFQDRYSSKRMRSDAQLWATTAYVVRNPVEAQLCARPEEWPWGSHAPIVNGHPPAWLAVDRLLELFASAGGDPLARYVEFVGQRPVGWRAA